jgi:hypothetical protein
MFPFSIHTMFDLKHPFAKNKFPTLGKWHQHPNVVGNKIIILFLHNNLSFFTFSLFNFFHTLGFFWKKLWWHVHLFGGNPPIMKLLLRLSFKPLFCPSCHSSFNPSSCGGTTLLPKRNLTWTCVLLMSHSSIYDYQTWLFIFNFFIHDFIYNMFYFL